MLFRSALGSAFARCSGLRPAATDGLVQRHGDQGSRSLGLDELVFSLQGGKPRLDGALQQAVALFKEALRMVGALIGGLSCGPELRGPLIECATGAVCVLDVLEGGQHGLLVLGDGGFELGVAGTDAGANAARLEDGQVQARAPGGEARSEEHTSELQSH